MNASTPTATSLPIDLELVAQRLLTLAQIATREHLESLLNSQAKGVLALTSDIGVTQ